MDYSLILEVYLFGVLLCGALTLLVIRLIHSGLGKFFQNLIPDPEISKFFVKLVSLIVFLGGAAAGLSNDYVVDPEKTNWLTLSWDVVDQLEATFNNLFACLILFSVVFLVLELLNRRFSK